MSVYVKNLDTDEVISINNKPMYSASLIKAFVMGEDLCGYGSGSGKSGGKDESRTGQSGRFRKKYMIFSVNMITVSDNESCNELGRLQDEKSDFLKGAESVNEYLKKKGMTILPIRVRSIRPDRRC